MEIYVTRDRQITKLSREKDIYVLTDIHGTLNEKIDGEMRLGFSSFYTDYAAANHAAKHAIKGGAGRTHITTITPDDEIVYIGGANAS